MEIQDTKYDLGDTVFGLAALAVAIATNAAAAAVLHTPRGLVPRAPPCAYHVALCRHWCQASLELSSFGLSVDGAATHDPCPDMFVEKYLMKFVEAYPEKRSYCELRIVIRCDWTQRCKELGGHRGS